MKTCLKCQERKDLLEFPKDPQNKDGFKNSCKSCVNKRNRKYYHNNKDSILEKKKQYYMTRREDILLSKVLYREENREQIRQTNRLYYERNKENITARINNDINLKLRKILRVRLNKALRGCYKTGSAVRDLGCSIEELKQHLENRFWPGMSWDNYGEWHIDHIVPLSSFDLEDRNQFLEACHYTNLQPLWAKDNLVKGRKFYDL